MQELHFTVLLVFKLEAQLKGALTFGSLDRADFEFMADFEQNILRYVRDEIDKQFALYQSSAAAGIKQAQDELDRTKRQLDRNIVSLDRSSRWSSSDNKFLEGQRKESARPGAGRMECQVSRGH